MNLSKRCTPYLWHSLVAIAVCMLILSPASATDSVHQGTDPGGGGGCENDKDCDGILDRDDMCVEAADHRLAAELNVCDSMVEHPDSYYGRFMNPYQTCSKLSEDITWARGEANLGGGIAILLCWFWPASLFAGVGGLSYSLHADRLQEMYDNENCGDSAR